MKIILNTYKESGKWYDTISYYTDLPLHDSHAIIEEAKTKAPKNVFFTIDYQEDDYGHIFKYRVYCNKI